MSKIEADLSSIVDDQDSAAKFDDLVRQNEEWVTENEGWWFCDFVRRSHAIAALLGIRRHLDNDEKSVSLLRLLRQLSEAAPQLTYDFYLTRFPLKPGVDYPWQSWTYRAFSKDGKTFDRTIVDDDIAKTMALAAKCDELATRTLAHLDKRGFSGMLTYENLRGVVKHFDELVCKYRPLLTSEGGSSIGATKIFNWMKVFRHPLVRPRPHPGSSDVRRRPDPPVDADPSGD
jgi:hypothetical protein